MKRVLLAAVAVGALALASSASAQDEKMYLSTAAGKQMVMGGSNTDGTELLVGTGAKPADCPAGSFYTTDASQQMVMKCDDDAQFNLEAPASGTMMSNGQPYPEGTMLKRPQS